MSVGDKKYFRGSPMYVLLIGGEAVYSTSDPADAIREARESVHQYITDHMRNDLPVQLTDEDISWMDVELHKLLGESSQMDIPYQKWADEYFAQQEKWEEEEKEEEYRTFVRLRGIYEERFQAESLKK